MSLLLALLSLVAHADIPCVPAGLEFQAQPVPGIANQVWPDAVVIQVVDARGNFCAADNASVVQLAFVPASPADGYIRQAGKWLPGNITNPIRVTNGIAKFETMAFSTGGVKRFLGVDANVKRALKQALSQPFTVPFFGNADRLGFVMQPATGGLQNLPWKQQPAVAVMDKFNNVVTSNNGTVIFIDVAQPPGATGHIVGGLTRVPTVNGLAHFSGLFVPSQYWFIGPGVPGAVLAGYATGFTAGYSSVFQ